MPQTLVGELYLSDSRAFLRWRRAAIVFLADYGEMDIQVSAPFAAAADDFVKLKPLSISQLTTPTGLRAITKGSIRQRYMEPSARIEGRC